MINSTLETLHIVLRTLGPCAIASIGQTILRFVLDQWLASQGEALHADPKLIFEGRMQESSFKYSVV
jgi:hypothetical protein